MHTSLPTPLRLPQLEIWSTLGAILHRSLSNIHMCRQLHLIQHCLEYLRKTTSDKVAGEYPVNQFMGRAMNQNVRPFPLFFNSRSCDQSC